MYDKPFYSYFKSDKSFWTTPVYLRTADPPVVGFAPAAKNFWIRPRTVCARWTPYTNNAFIRVSIT